MTTPDLPDLARRVAALEERLDMEAGLRAGGDRDLRAVTTKVAAIEATTRAMWLTQGEHTARLDEHLTMLLEIRGLLREQATVLAEHGAALVGIAEILHRLPGPDENGAGGS